MQFNLHACLGRATMSSVRCGYVDSPAGQIHYRTKAGSGTPLIYFHQTASSGKMWLKVIDRLGDLGPHFALDTPGFGGSFDPDSAHPMSTYVDWMAAAVRALSSGPVHLVGHHTGACIVCEMAARYPELAKSVTLIGPVPLTAEERVEFSKHFGTPFTPTITGSYLMDNWHYIDRLGAHADPLLFHREMTDQLRAWEGRVYSYQAVWGQDFTQYYKEIKAPLLIMCASDDVLYPFFGRAQEIRPDAVAVTLKGANFEPDLDPDTVSASIRAHVGG
jgi:pimeloyl-ACP methyl ester carboxylesterase